jgi:glycosyltransferase involved in cell wall biosynthesis
MAPRPIRVHALVDSLASGGAEMLLTELAAVAADAGLDLSIGYLKVGPGGVPGADRLREIGVEPDYVGVYTLGPGSTLKVRRHLRRVAPDIVHTHMGTSDVHGGLAARSLGIPAVSTVHAMRWERHGREGVKELLMTGVRRWCTDRVVAVSDVARDRYLAERRDVPAHVTVVRNGVRGEVPPAAGARVRAELGLAPDDVVVTVVAALRPEKAHEVAAEAIAIVRRDVPDVRLLVVGEGPSLPVVRRALEPLEGAGVLAGYRTDVMAVLGATDVLLHAPRFDALPTAVIEALGAGVPTVGTRVGGIPEIVEDGVSGVLVDPPPRADALAAALRPLVADRALRERIGAAARARFEREFSAESWARRLRALYDDVLARR